MEFLRPSDDYIDVLLYFDFPMYKTWEKGIKKHRPPMNTKDRREQIENMKLEEVSVILLYL